MLLFFFSPLLLVAAAWPWSPMLEPTAELSSHESVRLRNGVEMPATGLGTAGVREATIAAALAAGYRLIDTAMAKEWYDEGAAAAALHTASIARGDVFVTTKLHAKHHGYESALAHVRASALRFGGYVDLVLLHHPVCWLPMCDPKKVAGTWRDSWRALESALSATPPLVRAIGVSNFDRPTLHELLDSVASSPATWPMVVQNWMDPLHQDRAVRELCAARGIAFTAYSTLGTQHVMRGAPHNPVLKSPLLTSIGAAHGVSAAATALRWALQRGCAIIPRSTHPVHLAANRDLDFTLTSAELSAIDSLDGTDTSTEASGSSSDSEGGARRDGPPDRPVQLRATFVNQGEDSLSIAWIDHEGTAHTVVPAWDPGRTVQLSTFPDHTFAARDSDGRTLRSWTVPVASTLARGSSGAATPVVFTYRGGSAARRSASSTGDEL